MSTTALLDAIRAEQIAQHETAMALLEQPETQARIALAEDLATALDRAGFATLQQQIFKLDRYDRQGNQAGVVLIVHADIRRAHYLAGQAALVEILQGRGGQLTTESRYTEAGYTIDLTVHISDTQGWAPVWADKAA